MRLLPSIPTFAAVVLVSGLSFHPLGAQTAHFNPDLLPAVRRAASLIPGDAPTSVRVERLSRERVPLAGSVETTATDTVAVDNVVFQIRFPRGWIVVDAAEDHSFEPNLTDWSDDVYRRIHELMRDARLVVITHEHSDHIAGVFRSSYLQQIQAHTLLNQAQARTLMAETDQRIKLDSVGAGRFVVLDYEPLMPIAPGVVLIKAPGHTPGSQLVYVRLQSGAELVFAGDVAWNFAGIEQQRQKPEATLKAFGLVEDHEAITTELRWLREVAQSGIPVVVAHDGIQIDGLVARGVIGSGFDLRNR